MLLLHALDTYLAVRNPGGKPDTARLHRIAIDQFSATLGHDATVSDLTDENLGRHANRRLADGKSRDTVAGEQAKLLAQWRFYARRGLTSVWPECKPISRVNRTPKAWTRDELTRLYNACDFATPVEDTPGPLWWRALLLCLFQTGERISAMLALPWEGIEWDSGWITIPAESRKGSTQERRYKINSAAMEMLGCIPRNHPGPFAGRVTIYTLYNRLSRLLKRAGLPTDRRSKFHRIRRSTASHVAAAGGNAQEVLGHSSIKITKGYIDPAIAQQPQAVDWLFQLDDVV